MINSCDVHFKVSEQTRQEINMICMHNSLTTTRYFILIHKKWFKDNRHDILDDIGGKDNE